MFDGLGIGMRFGELLSRTLEVRPRLFDILLQLLVIPVQLLVEVEVRILDLGVLLPRVLRRTTHHDLKPRRLDGTGEGLAQAAFGDEGLYGFLHLRTECFERCFGLVTCYLRSEKLVNDFKICFHNV